MHAVRLEARELPPFTPQHRELFDERPQQYLGWEQLRERLRARLGDEAVQGLSAVAEHRPERSWRPHSCDRAQSPAACGLRPGWLLAEPRPSARPCPPCWPARSGSSRAGGMAKTSAATITWWKPAADNVPGSIARSAAKGRCGCMAGSHERLRRTALPVNFSFQRGASSAAELFARAARLGYRALAITDECSLAGIVRAWQAAREHQVQLIIGSEIRLEQGPKLVLLAEDLEGYQNLCRLITRGRRQADKGHYRLLREDLQQPLAGLLAIWLPNDHGDEQAAWLRERFPSAFGWASSCIAAPMTMPAWTNCSRSPRISGYRPWPAATSTCTPAAGEPCRTA